MVTQPGEHSVEMVNQLLGSRREDIDIVHITDANVIQQIMEDVLHETAEGGRRVGETERHSRPLEESSSGAES